MILNEKEQRALRTIAKWFKENKSSIDRDEAIKELGVDDTKYETLIKMMERLGVVKDVSSAAGERYAKHFEPTAYAEILARDIQNEQKKAPDIVEQLKTRIQQNPWTAWPVVIFIVLALLVPLINQLWDLITKFIK
jgi:hypothetical protein